MLLPWRRGEGEIRAARSFHRFWPRGGDGRSLRPGLSLPVPVLWTLLALGFLLACDLLLFRNAILEGQIYYRPDTVTYYLPIAERARQMLREGQLMLWTRDIFGGFPLFADGEGGMLYPPNLIAYLMLPEQDAFIWLNVTRYFMAAVFTYGYLRTLRLNRFASTAGALSFTFGSFMVTQMHHNNVVSTALWLPLTLAALEKALGSVGSRRWLYVTGAGVSTGIQALGLHIQPLIMSGLFLAAYIPFRVLLCPIAWPAPRRRTREGGPPAVVAGGASSPEAAHLPQPEMRAGRDGTEGAPESWWRPGRLLVPVARRIPSLLLGGLHRSALTLVVLAAIPALAFGIAATQVIPLVELGMLSFRGTGVTYQFATSYSMPVQNLINLIFPYFFRYTNLGYWSLWSEWETTLYAGIGTLVLAGVALIFVRNRMVLFFAVATAGSLLLAFGSYSPYPLYERLWSLPGFSSLRVPGRFTMLVTFCLAVLAAYGLDWLCRTLRPVQEASLPGRWGRLSRSVSLNGFAIYLIALLSGMAGVAWWLVGFRSWVERAPWEVKRLAEQSYLALRNDRSWLTSDMLLSYLNYSLDPTNQKTATSLLLMLAVFLLLFCWFAFRRFWRVWATLAVGLVAVDMMLFAVGFHPTVRIGQLSGPDPAARWLMSQTVDGQGRVYTPRDVRTTEANKLLPFRVPDIGGYSSLETERHREFMARLNEVDRPLLNLSGVRFVVMPKRPPALPSFEYTAYNPNRALADGPRTNPGANVTFYTVPPIKADEVAFISNLRSADSIPQDAEVAEIVVVDTEGQRVTLKVRAGRDTSEWAWDRPDVTPRVAHQRARVAGQVMAGDSDGRRFQANLYYGRLPLDRTRTIARVEFHYIYPQGAVRLYGMMLWEKPRTAHQLVSGNRFIPRYEDDEVQILENPTRLPRAYLVPAARIVGQRSLLDTMTYGDFDPAKEALLEAEAKNSPSVPLLPLDAPVPDPQVVQSWLQGDSQTSPGTAEIVEDRATSVEVRTVSSRNALLLLGDSYYPGWKATVDGSPAPLFRANYLFRAVPVPQGEHRVRFSFQPESVALGTRISLLTLSGLLLIWSIVLGGIPLARWAWRRGRRPVREG